jgi:TonB family protein
MRILMMVAFLALSMSNLIWTQSSSSSVQHNDAGQPQQSRPSPPAEQPVKAPKDEGTSKPRTYTLEPVASPSVPYPVSAREQKIQGEVVGMVLVSEAGTVENFSVSKGDPLLTKAVEEVIKNWSFKPIVADGRAIPVIAKVTFHFVSGKDDKEPTAVAPEIAPASKFPERVRVSQGVSQGMILSKPVPSYPPEARKAHSQGSVVMHALINTQGEIGQLQLVSGPPELSGAAMDAVRRWRYKPYLLMGRPIDVGTLITVNFTLQLQ